ncbi:DUF3298 and DUF4163 domain-containing protein [Fulvimonas soli]|jgi:hypothetical protein|uniref:DUF3298 domain-containing protein n=1 Tax=Fulvimonas soli TaxID=155197 RepID=A0A316I039_9GAMM|nr:DUF3298 and DUF4163 domain-containing protein [Fulvimonas soli]PWK85823.1 hypothetical protein C7456_108119 [Fulvimonas soli]TNY27269.1 hypothetical protein BV497_04630 [Fulvimonas soli]
MPSLPKGCFALGVALLLSACGSQAPGNAQTPASAPAPAAAPSLAATTQPPAAASATTPATSPDGQLTDSGSGDKYRYAIHYPPLPPAQAPLGAALRALGDRARRDFLAQAGPAAQHPTSAAYPWELTLDFKVVAQTPDLVSVVGQGGAFTGGAHGNPILLTVLYDARAGRTLALDDLFADPAAARRVLADAARADLLGRLEGPQDQRLGSDRKWIEEGTAPTAENYQAFALLADGGKARGLRLLFPAYQVASYADGVQHVDVPAAGFAALLKPAYRDAFATP